MIEELKNAESSLDEVDKIIESLNDNPEFEELVAELKKTQQVLRNTVNITKRICFANK